jgi:CPA2 family monovalent cation:H+ antiporter-2
MQLGIRFVCIELDHRRFEEAKGEGMSMVYGDAGQEVVLEAAGIKDASLLILTVPGLVEVRTVVSHAKRLNQRLEIVARTSGEDYFDVFKELGISQVVFPEFEASLEMTRQSLLRLGIPLTEIQRHTDTARQELYERFFKGDEDYHLLSQLRNAEQQFDLQWFQVPPESPVALKTIGESEVRKRTGASIVGVVRDGRLVPNPDAGFVLEGNDMVAIIGSDENRKAFCNLASTDCHVDLEDGGEPSGMKPSCPIS